MKWKKIKVSKQGYGGNWIVGWMYRTKIDPTMVSLSKATHSLEPYKYSDRWLNYFFVPCLFLYWNLLIVYVGVLSTYVHAGTDERIMYSSPSVQLHGI